MQPSSSALSPEGKKSKMQCRLRFEVLAVHLNALSHLSAVQSCAPGQGQNLEAGGPARMMSRYPIDGRAYKCDPQTTHKRALMYLNAL